MLPNAGIEGFEVEVLDQVLLQTLSMTFGHELIEQVNVYDPRWFLIELLHRIRGAVRVRD